MAIKSVLINRGRRQSVVGAAALAMLTEARAQGFKGGVSEALGPRFQPDPQTGAKVTRLTQLRRPRSKSFDMLRHWHDVALACTGIDHTPTLVGETRVFGEQLGPGRSSRAMAIAHIAMFDAINATAPRYRGYTDLRPAATPAAADVALAHAAHDTLVALFPSQRDDLDEELAQSLANVRDLAGRGSGALLGRQAAAAILAKRGDDHADHDEPRVGDSFRPRPGPGHWRPDPVSEVPLALGAKWHEVTPFVLRSASQFRVPPPPALDSPEYAAAFDEAKRLGGDGIMTATVRTEPQTRTGVFWAYDGVPSLCAPPRLYNQLTMSIAGSRRLDPLDLARLLALVNIALADAGVACWESKYFFQLWRPVTGVRAARGPLIADPTFTPLGAPASNFNGPNFTPPFPAYPSGHATFGGALFEVLRDVFGTDRIGFDFVSDEMNGETRDNAGNVRPRLVRHFDSLSEAEEENGHSRIYLGIHWAFDKTVGIAQGRRVGRWVARNVLQRR